MKRLTKIGSGAALAGLVSLVAVAPGASAAVLPNCVPSTNIETITDDSGSMALTDSTRQRVALLSILAGNPLNQGKTMGGVEFGDEAGDVFPVQPIGSPAAQASIEASLAAVQANGFAGGGAGTNYNAGFTAGNAQNGGANARIFLSDGVPNTGDYDPNIPRTPPIKTYVVGFDAAATGAAATLAEIAAGTGGQVLNPANNSATALQQTAGELLALLNCKTPPATKVLTVTKKPKVQAFKAQGSVADVLLSWTTPGVTINANAIRSGAIVAETAAKKGKKGKKVKVSVQKGATFTALHFSKLKKGQKVRFRVKGGKTLVLPTQVTSQTIQ
jgi:hypothetical protein